MTRPRTAVIFSANEVDAIKAMVKRLAELEREDVIGAIVKTSGSQFLDDEGVVALARKLGDG